MGFSDKLACPAGKRDGAVFEHIAAMGDGERLHHVLLDQQDRQALLVDALDQGEHGLDQQG